MDVVDVGEPGPAVLLRDGDSEHAEAAGALERVHGKVLGFVPLGEVRLDLAERKVAHHLLNLGLLVGEAEIHSGS